MWDLTSKEKFFFSPSAQFSRAERLIFSILPMPVVEASGKTTWPMFRYLFWPRPQNHRFQILDSRNLEIASVSDAAANGDSLEFAVGEEGYVGSKVEIQLPKNDAKE